MDLSHTNIGAKFTVNDTLEPDESIVIPIGEKNRELLSFTISGLNSYPVDQVDKVVVGRKNLQLPVTLTPTETDIGDSKTSATGTTQNIVTTEDNNNALIFGLLLAVSVGGFTILKRKEV